MAGNSGDEKEECLRLYKNDSRIPCKYGVKCYQKNPVHHEKYKHPSNKYKLNNASKEEKYTKITKEDISKQSPNKHTLDDEGKDERCAKRTKDDIPKQSPNDGSSHPGGSSAAEEEEFSLPDDVKEAIKEAFLVEMPNDFYSFWSFCLSLKKDNPAGALKDVGLFLVGPFDLILNRESFKKCKKVEFLRHWRYYFDPPEFQTVIKGDDKTEFHLGYYRDDPSSDPCFVASNSAAVDCTITPVAENLFGAVNSYLETRKNKSDPFHKMKISSLQKSLHSWAKENNFDLDVNTAAMKARARKVVAKTFHKGGIVVPVNKTNDTGYRPLIESEVNLKKILKNYANSDSDDQRKALMDKLQPIITAANIANDECDFGTSLELGLDLFSFGGDVFHGMIKHLLCTAYALLNREAFAEIITAHLGKRLKGPNLSVLVTSGRS
ncbi:Uncharacterized protein GBIM_06210 [Gryllus bimaculatus]|nr:Uncharacterized protein GBIM_06210 [Gryllus bimaculatus]